MTTTTLSKTVLKIDTGDGIEVQVDVDLLREHNWIPEEEADEHCGHDLDASYADGIQEGRSSALRGDEGLGVGELLKRFHDDHHEGPYQFCYSRPCHEIRQTLAEDD